MGSNQELAIDHDLIDALLDEFDRSPTPTKATSNPNPSEHRRDSVRVNDPMPSNDDAADGPVADIFEKLLRSVPLEDGRKRPESLQESLQEAARMIKSHAAASSSTKEPDEDELIHKLMEELQIGSDSNIEESVEKLMSQMLSAETLEEPVKQVTAKYPQWLAEHGPRLSDSERINYEKQYAVFKRLRAMFGSGQEPGSDAIMAMMAEVQQYGQPPREIIQELVPGLEFSDDGDPVLKDLPPELAALTPDQPNCILM